MTLVSKWLSWLFTFLAVVAAVTVIHTPRIAVAQSAFPFTATCDQTTSLVGQTQVEVSITVDTSDVPGATGRLISDTTTLPNHVGTFRNPGFPTNPDVDYVGILRFDFSSPIAASSGSFTAIVRLIDNSHTVVESETRTIVCGLAPEPTATTTDTATATTTATSTATATDTATATVTTAPTETPSATDTATATTTATSTTTATDTATATVTTAPTETSTATDTATATSTPTETPTNTATATATETPTETATATATETSVPTETATTEPTATSTTEPTSTSAPVPVVSANDFAISLNTTAGSASGSFADHTTSSDPVTYGLVSTPQFGTVTFDPTTGEFVYTLNSNVANGIGAAAIIENDSFTYSASVGEVTDTGVVSVAIDDGITPGASPVAPTVVTVPPVVSLPSTGSGSTNQFATYLVLLGAVGLITIAGSLMIRQRREK